MTSYIIIESTEIKDIEDFKEKFESFVFPKYEGKGIGENSAFFELKITEGNPILIQKFGDNELTKLVADNKRLRSKNKKLKKALKPHLPKQDLSVNDAIIIEIIKLRKKGSTYEKIAKKLNKKGFRNSRGNKLNMVQIGRLYKKYLSAISSKQNR